VLRVPGTGNKQSATTTASVVPAVISGVTGKAHSAGRSMACAVLLESATEVAKGHPNELHAEATDCEDRCDPFALIDQVIFSFNEEIDAVVLEPLANAYDLLPNITHDGARIVLRNAATSAVLVNGPLQGAVARMLTLHLIGATDDSDHNGVTCDRRHFPIEPAFGH